MKTKVVDTKDGSKSLYLPELDETYHSHHGALRESQHVYIKSGIEYLIETEGLKKLRIFEMGFGTGLNAFLTAHFAKSHGTKIFYRTIEKFPVSLEDHSRLEYFTLPPLDGVAAECQEIVEAKWGVPVGVNEFFTLEKINGDFFDVDSKGEAFDIIYFDAFGYRAQNELWEAEAFAICASLLREGGILVTYASKGLARRNLIAAGFDVERIPGAPGKREMMRATKI